MKQKLLSPNRYPPLIIIIVFLFVVTVNYVPGIYCQQQPEQQIGAMYSQAQQGYLLHNAADIPELDEYDILILIPVGSELAAGPVNEFDVFSPLRTKLIILAFGVFGFFTTKGTFAKA